VGGVRNEKGVKRGEVEGDAFPGLRYAFERECGSNDSYFALSCFDFLVVFVCVCGLWVAFSMQGVWRSSFFGLGNTTEVI